MVQGRISFSRGSNGARAFKSGRYGAFDDAAGEMARAGAYSGEVRRPAASGEAIPFRPILDGSDDWILESIERKRARLLQISIVQRHRIEEFVELLFDEGSDACADMVDRVYQECGDPQKVVELLFEPAARIIGENWCADECDFLKVTIAVSRMQRLFRRLSSEHPPISMPDLSRCALLAPAPGEQHTFGLSVVEDAFRRGGWDVDCCGCGEEQDVFRLVASNSYLIAGISVSVERQLSDLAGTVSKLRSKSRNCEIVLIAGGSMAMQNPQGALDAGFDLIAVDAVSALSLAETVLASLDPGAARRVAAE